jgi:hypothetical protein
MSGARRSAAPIVSRTYMDEPDYCMQAIQLLLKTSVRKEDAHPGVPNDAMKGSKHDRAETIIPE